MCVKQSARVVTGSDTTSLVMRGTRAWLWR